MRRGSDPADIVAGSIHGFHGGRVCITTMHQSKGLEWPVTAVVCGGLVGKSNGWDHAIARYSRRKQHHRGALGAPLDQLRQFYVGCTRAENLLILSANQAISTGSGVRPHVWAGIPRWSFMDTDEFGACRNSVHRTIIVQRYQGSPASSTAWSASCCASGGRPTSSIQRRFHHCAFIGP